MAGTATTTTKTTVALCRCTSQTCAYHRWTAQPATFAEYVRRFPTPQDETWIGELLAADAKMNGAAA